MTIYQPYTYLIGWSRINKWYYGVRFAEHSKCLYETGCHPDELWVTYFTSSRDVAYYRKQYGEPDIIEVRKTFDDPLKAQRWEQRFLTKVNALYDDRWLNRSICGGILMDETTKQRISLANKKPKTKEHSHNISKGRKGIVFSETHRNNIRSFRLGKKASEETKLKRSSTMSTLKWFNDGTTHTRSASHPGEGWVEGRIGWAKTKD
ncbi:hypothetical protein EVB91_137 [Rhizobium phage RHph_I1_18]|nr:hypothetical protein EVB91_137 [Rhizobium phage RHph_I1_18]